MEANKMFLYAVAKSSQLGDDESPDIIEQNEFFICKKRVELKNQRENKFVMLRSGPRRDTKKRNNFPDKDSSLSGLGNQAIDFTDLVLPDLEIMTILGPPPEG